MLKSIHSAANLSHRFTIRQMLLSCVVFILVLKRERENRICLLVMGKPQNYVFIQVRFGLSSVNAFTSSGVGGDSRSNLALTRPPGTAT